MTIKIPVAKLEKRKGVDMPVMRRESAARMASKVLHEPAYILHSQPYSETSLILDVFTRNYGRISVLAKGAKRPYTQWRASLFQTFQTLSLAFTGKSQVKTLLDLEWVGGIPMLQGSALLAGYYMNEWMRRALALDDPHAALFEAYQHSLADLSLSDSSEHAACLRRFEMVLLRELGYGVPLETPTGQIDAEMRYILDLTSHQWLETELSDSTSGTLVVHGQTLLDMADMQFHAPKTALESKHVLRFLLHASVSSQPLNTRSLLINLHNLSSI